MTTESLFSKVLVASSNLDGAQETFKQQGVMVIPKDSSEILDFNEIRRKLLNVLEEYKQVAESKGGLGLKKENGFRELVQKDVGRFDLNLDHLLPHNQNKGSQSRELSTNEDGVLQLYNYVHNRIEPFLLKIFGSNYQLNAFGAVISHPNTTAQDWHVDSSHLFVAENNQQQELYGELPCHFVTVFCPLYDYEANIGPTEIAVSSHHYTAILKNQIVEDQYPKEEIVNKLLHSAGVERMEMMTKMGDVGIMDGRTLHRGGFNQSEKVRPLMYLSYCLPWYYEYPRSQNDGRSLF